MLKIYLFVLLGLACACGDEACPENWFDCKNGKCVSSVLVCDGEDECGNGMDEIGCEDTHRKLEAHKCPTHHYKCEQSHLCVPNKWICDGHKDCPQKDDERNCTRAKSSCEGFFCHNMQCIPKRWHCDGSTDCEDGSDELGCGAGKVQKLCGFANGYYQCITGQCINKTKVCDGHRDCPKGDDEGESCHDDRCATHGCSHTCINTPLGARCLCQEGYKISPNDDKQCVDRDECAEGPQHMCSHLCTNLPGSFRCSCYDGYELEKDNRTCRAKGSSPILYFTDSFSIRSFDLRANRYSRIHRTLSEAHGIAVSVQHERIFWSEYGVEGGKVYSSSIKGDGLKDLITVGLQKPEEIAFDWVTGNLYIADSHLRSIIVCSASCDFCKTVIREESGSFRSISIDPRGGFMYWTYTNLNVSGIYMGHMDGTNRKAVVVTNIEKPYALTLDEARNRLYWTDQKRGTVEYYDLRLGHRKTVISAGVYESCAIAVFDDNVYWSDVNRNKLITSNKLTGANKTELKRSIFGIRAMAVFHPFIQPPLRNRCLSNPCSHMCVLVPFGFACVCPEYLQLAGDNKTCISKNTQHFLLIATNGAVKKIYPELIGRGLVMETIIPSIMEVNTFAYDKVAQILYLTSKNFKGIWTVNINGDKPKLSLIANSTVHSIVSLIYDEHSNNLYLLDKGNRSLSVLSRDGASKVVLLSNLDNAVDLVLDQRHGRIFVAISGSDPHIKVISVDGKNTTSLAIENFGVPQALFLDTRGNRLYFTDSEKGTIEMITLENAVNQYQKAHTSIMLMKGLGAVNSLALYNDSLYWTNKENRSLLSALMRLAPNYSKALRHKHELSMVDKVVSVWS